MKKFTTLTLLLLSMITMTSNIAIATALPFIKEHFAHADNIDFYSKLMLTLPSAAVAILAPILGHLIFNFGKKKSAIFALFLFSLSGSAGLYLESIDLLLLSRILFGASIAILMIVTTSLVGDYYKDEERNKYMGYQMAFMATGGVLFVVLGGIVSDISWRLSFGIYLIGVLLLPLAFRYLKEIPLQSITHDKDEALDSNMYGIYFLSFFYMLIFFILHTQVPFLLIEKFDISGSQTGLIIAVAFVSNAFGAIYFSKLKSRYSFTYIYLLVLGLLGIGYLIIAMASNMYYFFVSNLIVGFAGGVMMTNVTAWMLSKTDAAKRVKASAYFTSSLFLGQFLSPIVFYPLVSNMRVQNFFLLIGLVLFVIVILAKFYLRNKKKITILINKG